MSVTAFHKQRRMFYCQGSYVTIAPEGDVRSHKAWMADTGVSHLFNKVLRGYADSTGIYIYKGDTFALDGGDFEAARHCAKIVGLRLRLVPSLAVWGGVVPGQEGKRWRGRMKLGTIRSVARTEQPCVTKADAGA